MILNSLPNTVTKYHYSFNKKSYYKKKTLIQIDSNGIISHLRENDESESIEKYTFRCLEYKYKNIKSPLILNPVKWIYNTNLNVAAIKNKENHKLVWNKYRDKHRTPQNQASFMVIERLYFHTPLGLEYDAFSNGIYLLFFIPLNAKIKKDTFIKGLDWLNIPINLPFNTTFRCSDINNKFINLKGWISLDEKILDELIRNDNFKNKAMKYHFSKDFQVESEIDLIIEVETKSLYKADFNLEIKGDNNNLHETMNYSILSEYYNDKNKVYKTYEGKKYTKDEWEQLEKKLYEKYSQNKNTTTNHDIEIDKKKKGGNFFLDEREH